MMKSIAKIITLVVCLCMLTSGVVFAAKDAETAESYDAAQTGSRVLTLKLLLIQGIATSIDALSVGFTIAAYSAGQAVVSSLIIGVVTLFICIAGLYLGRSIGTRLAGKASVLGGVILIAIGIEIWARGVFF